MPSARLGHDALALVERGVVAGHRLALLQHPLAAAELVVERRLRRRHRGVDEAQRPGLELGVARGVDGVGRLVERDRVLAAAHQIDDPQLQAAGDPLGHHQVLGEDVEVVEHDPVAGGDQRLGAAEVGPGRVDLHQPEIAAGVVDAHVEAAGAMVEVVLDIGAAREDDAKRRLVRRRGGVQDALLVGVLALARQHQEAVVAGLADAEIEQLVLLLEQQRIGVGGADDVAPELVGALGLVHRHVVEGAAVVGPRRRRHLGHRPGVVLAGREIADMQGEVAPAGQVEGIGEGLGVEGDGGQAEAQERLAARHLVEVEQGLVLALGVVAAVGPERVPPDVARDTARLSGCGSNTTTGPCDRAPSRRPAGSGRTSPGRAFPSAPHAARTRHRRRRSRRAGRAGCAGRRAASARSSRRCGGRRERSRPWARAARRERGASSGRWSWRWRGGRSTRRRT